MSTKKIATSTFWQLASQVTMAALSILTVKLVAIGLSKELAGIYNSAYGYLQLFGILADFGLYAVAIKEVSRTDEKQKVFGALIILRTIILCISLGSALLFVWLLPYWQGTPLPMAVTIASLVPFFTLLSGMLRTVFQVTYNMQYVFITEVLHRIVTTALIAGVVIFYALNQTDNVTYCYLFLFFGGIGTILLFFMQLIISNHFMPISVKTDRQTIIRLLKSAAPYGAAYFCVALYRQFDLTLIALLRPDFELQNAYYGFVLRMSDMGFVIPTFLLNSTLPLLSEGDSKGHDTSGLLGKTMLILLLLGSVSSLFALLWPRPLMQLLTSENYLSTISHSGSDTALRLLSAPLFCNGLILYGFYVLLTRHHWQKLVITLAGAVLIAITLNILLIPDFGFVGAAWTMIAVHVLLMLFLFPQGYKAMPISLSNLSIVKWLIFSGLLAGFLFVTKPYLINEWWTVTGLGAAVLFMLVTALGLRLDKDFIDKP